MQFDDFSKFLLPGGFLTLGAFLTAVRGKMTSAKKKNTLHWIFYLISGIVILASVIGAIAFWKELFPFDNQQKFNWNRIVVIFIAFISGFLLLWFTNKNKKGKYQYKTSELDEVVNQFTRNADKHNIRLLAGDLNFFGNTPQEMDQNKQYQCLKSEKFRQIQVICFRPTNIQERVRYGKLLSEMRIEVKYYHPQDADLNVRGRMKKLGRVTHLLIYNKVASGEYEALELDTADSHGALYDHIWNLIWQLAESPTAQEIQEYKELYRRENI